MEPRDYIDLKNVKVPKQLSPRTLGLGLIALLVIMLLYSSYYQVGTESVGVVLFLGKFDRLESPGLHFRWPILETVDVVTVQRQLKEEFGFRTLRAGIRTEYSKGQFLDESLMLTGDLNVAVVEWSVQYRIADPFKYLYRIRNARETFRDMTEAVMREIIGDRTVNEVLTIGRTEVARSAQDRLQLLCDQYETGIRVEQVILQNTTPPDPVKPSFNEVNQAQQEREKLINEARAEYNLAVPRAEGEAQQQISQAEGYAIDRVNRARGEADRFRSLFAEYRKAPEVTRRRIYLETLGNILPKTGRKLIVDKEATGVIPLLQLNNEGRQ